MEYIITIVIMLISIVILKIGLNIHIKDIKRIKKLGYDKELNKIVNKFPENKLICEKILKKLNNEKVAIEEENNTKTSLYIALSNKIIIANIKDTFTRIQTITHECLHSVQNRKILLFNFIFSNIVMIYFLIAIPLLLLDILDGYIFVRVYIGMEIISYIVKAYLENDAMTKAFYVAKEYMLEYKEENNEITNEDITKLLNNMEELNKIGIPFTNFYLIFEVILKTTILCILGFIGSLL